MRVVGYRLSWSEQKHLGHAVLELEDGNTQSVTVDASELAAVAAILQDPGEVELYPTSNTDLGLVLTAGTPKGRKHFDRALNELRASGGGAP